LIKAVLLVVVPPVVLDVLVFVVCDHAGIDSMAAANTINRLPFIIFVFIGNSAD
jgi:hypothetical protein